MRKALWFLSAPVVAGGLAWAVNAADEHAPTGARAPSAQTGKIHYFSRSGQSAAARTAASDEAADEAEADTPLPSQSAARYVRKRPGKPLADTRNYQDLFSEAAPRDAAPQKARPVAAKPTRAPAPPVEECGVSEASPEGDESPAREEHPLPAADADVELAHGERDGDEILHAEHTASAGQSQRRVQQAQHAAKSAVKSRTAASRLPRPAADDDEEMAPPPPATKTTRPATAKAARPTTPSTRRPATAAARTSKTPAPAAAATARARTARKSETQITQAQEETTEASPAPVQQAIAVAADTSDVPLISLKWAKRGDVNVGQECKCGLVVKNNGKLPAKDIVVEAFFPRTVRLLDAEPFPSDSKDHLAWTFDHLQPGEEKSIEITMIPGRRGELATSATVRFTGVASTVIQVEEPQLSLAVAGPQDVMVGETTTQVITVSNPGSGVAHDVIVHAHVPDGLDHPRGKSVEIAVGSLGPGEAREIRLPLTAAAGGEATLKVEARGTNLSQKAQTLIQVAAPKLKVEVAGPGLRYINRHAQYTITVTNDGVAATDNVRIVHLVPEGFEYVKSDRGGKHDPATGSVTWFVGRLEAGQSTQVACDLNAARSGDYQHHVQASGENGTIAAARLESKVDAASAVVMEVADLDDPVEVETETAYEIRIRNDGSKAAQNLRLACELPAGVELLGAEGPSGHGTDKGLLSFKPVSELPAGGKITYRLKVSGKTAGNLRLRAKLTTSASNEPLVVEELTKFYAD